MSCQAATAPACWSCSTKRGIATPVACIGWPDQFIEHASAVDHLREKYGLTVANAVAQVKELSNHREQQAAPLAAQI